MFEQQYSPENIIFVIDLDRETNTPLSGALDRMYARGFLLHDCPTGAPGPSRLESLKESLKSFALIKVLVALA